MARLVIPFLGCEGPNDRNFLLPMLRKVFEQAALDHGFELLDTFLADDYVTYSAGCGLSHAEWVQQAAKQAVAFGDGDAILCIHKDADSDATTSLAAVEQARQALSGPDSLAAGLVVPVVPARTIEAWLLADAEVIGRRLNPDLPPHKLELAADPESYPDAKKKLRETHALAHADRRRRQPARIEIGELYAAMGTDLSLQQLKKVASFGGLLESVDKAFQALKATY